VSIIVIYLGATNTNIDNRVPNWWGCNKYGKSLRSTTTITNMMIRFYSKLLHWVLNIVLKSIDTVQHPSYKIPLIIFYWLTDLAIFNSNAQHIRNLIRQKEWELEHLNLDLIAWNILDKVVQHARQEMIHIID